MGLIGKVLKDKLHESSALGVYTHEDLFQIGCVGLCKAVAEDKKTGCFSTFAYRLIWNEICDALVLGNRYAMHEAPAEDLSDTHQAVGGRFCVFYAFCRDFNLSHWNRQDSMDDFARYGFTGSAVTPRQCRKPCRHLLPLPRARCLRGHLFFYFLPTRSLEPDRPIQAASKGDMNLPFVVSINSTIS